MSGTKTDRTEGAQMMLELVGCAVLAVLILGFAGYLAKGG